jgi:UDP-GlcNAc3NAcA epimerase
MSNSPHVLTVVGARPQFVKAAPVSRALLAAGIDEVMVHTGQHFDANMSDVFFEELEIPAPRYNLDIHGGNHGAMTARMLAAIEETCLAEKPDTLLIYGDTNSTLAGALAASKLHIPVLHVEAGLRSFNRAMPEELNRVVADHLSSLLFCPSQTAVDNLAAEGIAGGVHFVGDVMQDATLFAQARARGRTGLLQSLGVETGGFALCTLHRAENTDDPARLRTLLAYLVETAEGRPVVWPIHPRTRDVVAREGIALDGIVVTDPVGYFDMHALLAHAACVFTDSGGLQKEAYFHRVPCVTLRDETEWVETIGAGWNRLWTVADYREPRAEIPDYGDGNAAGKIAALIRDFLAERRNPAR